jgi:hypothetical protein
MFVLFEEELHPTLQTSLQPAAGTTSLSVLFFLVVATADLRLQFFPRFSHSALSEVLTGTSRNIRLPLISGKGS